MRPLFGALIIIFIHSFDEIETASSSNKLKAKMGSSSNEDNEDNTPKLSGRTFVSKPRNPNLVSRIRGTRPPASFTSITSQPGTPTRKRSNQNEETRSVYSQSLPFQQNMVQNHPFEAYGPGHNHPYHYPEISPEEDLSKHFNNPSPPHMYDYKDYQQQPSASAAIANYNLFIHEESKKRKSGGPDSGK